MSQKAVETLLGRILTDEDFRKSFFPLAPASFELAAAQGFDLTAVERQALGTLEARHFEPLARDLDLRICRSYASEAAGGDREKRKH